MCRPPLSASEFTCPSSGLETSSIPSPTHHYTLCEPASPPTLDHCFRFVHRVVRVFTHSCLSASLTPPRNVFECFFVGVPVPCHSSPLDSGFGYGESHSQISWGFSGFSCWFFTEFAETRVFLPNLPAVTTPKPHWPPHSFFSGSLGHPRLVFFSATSQDDFFPMPFGTIFFSHHLSSPPLFARLKRYPLPPFRLSEFITATYLTFISPPRYVVLRVFLYFSTRRLQSHSPSYLFPRNLEVF